jgi:DNA-binding transcriptional MerR regulator
MLRIGDFSKLCRVTIKALRYYDEIGLLKPDYIGEENGYRYYRPDKLKKISEIISYRDMGFSLDEIASLINSNSDSLSVHNMVIEKQTQVISGIHSEKQKLAKLNAFIKSLEEERIMSNVSLKELPEVIVASTRTIIPNYAALFEVAPAMGQKMQIHGAICRDPAYCFNIYHDGEYKETDIDVEICEAVVDFCKNADGVTYKKIPYVKTAACIFHKGLYETLGKSYAEIFTWIEKNGYKVSAHPRESYIDGCWNKEDPNNWLTEIQVPITK